MRRGILSAMVFSVLALVGLGQPSAWADDYTVDPVHSSVTFKIEHLGISWIHGRFDDVSGSFMLDKDDPAKSSFTMTIKVESVNTNNVNRDKHLKSPDFFNVKQNPTLSFKSTKVKAADGGYTVTGDVTMHGKTKEITFKLTGGKEVEFPAKVKRTGFSTEFTLKRSDFGMDKFLDKGVGDDVPVSISFEGSKK
jgi:polyisoprenoid-binding protein YceI